VDDRVQSEHSVTFGNGPAGTPPDEWPVTGLTGTVPPPPGIANLTGTYAGSGFLNTGLLWPDSTATVQFTAAGSLPYICVIHPGMAGTVNVVASGTTTTQAEADAKATQTRDALQGAVAGLQASAEAVTETGVRTHEPLNISRRPWAGRPAGRRHRARLLRFIRLPVDRGRRHGRGTAPSVHTVTFPAHASSTIDRSTRRPAAHLRRVSTPDCWGSAPCTPTPTN
jgi:hypothetical protein